MVVLPFVPVDAGDLERARRLAEEGVGGDRHRRAGVLDDELRHVELERTLDDERDGAGRHGLGGEVVPVGPRAGHAEEHRARRTRRASYARSVTSTAPRAVLSLAASTRVRSSRSTEPHSTAGRSRVGCSRPTVTEGGSRPRYWPVVAAFCVSGASGGTSRYCRSNRAMSLNAGAATLPP